MPQVRGPGVLPALVCPLPEGGEENRAELVEEAGMIRPRINKGVEFPETAMKSCFLRALNYMAKMVESPWVDMQGQRAIKTQFQDPKHIDVLRSHHLQALYCLCPVPEEEVDLPF